MSEATHRPKTGFAVREHPLIESPRERGDERRSSGSDSAVSDGSDRSGDSHEVSNDDSLLSAAIFSGTDPLSHLGELPRSYGDETIFLVAQDPHWLFTYWDFDIARHPGGPAYLRYGNAAGHIEGEIEVAFETRNWYIPVRHAGATYVVEIGYYREGNWILIGRSAMVQTPAEGMSERTDFSYATVPLHLSFQNLLDHVRAATHSGESLLDTLSRLQRTGALPGVTPFDVEKFEEMQRAVLQALLGKDVFDRISSGGMSSEEITALIREEIRQKVSSESSSGLFSGGLSSATLASSGESSLFGMLQTLSSAGLLSGWSGSALSSWAVAASSSWAAAALSSVAASARASWETGAGASWTSAAASSWGGGSEYTIWLQAALSSWTEAALTSWSEAALSSWTEAALSSYTQAALSSYTHAAVSSWETAGSSWSGQAPVPSRDFFMNVNAEVIFYGGTHPEAKVSVNGEPITLHPDGTFSYHFKFPNNGYDIRISAQSPDAVESREATLHFTRDTEKSGEVDDTSQPAHLTTPMGPRG